MNTCLVTQLKAVVNDPNLPVIETMQQVTLNAITLSGKSMTDAQKLALNHFYYQIGAVNNGSLWQKIDFMFLPMLAGTVDKVSADYKSMALLPLQGSINNDVVLGNNGVIAGTTSRKPITLINYSSYDPNDISCYLSLSDNLSTNPGNTSENRLIYLTDTETEPNTRLTMYLGTSGEKQRVNFTEDSGTVMYGTNNYGGSEYLCSLYGDDTEHTAYLKCRNKNNEEVEIYQNYSTGALYEGTMTNGRYQIICYKQSLGYSVSASIVGKALTEAEANTLMTAVTTLKQSFIVNANVEE